MDIPVDAVPSDADDAVDPGVEAAGASDLKGTFKVTATKCSGAISGSHFRMIQPGGTLEAGPFVENSDSTCADKTYTPLKPGTDGGLLSGTHQPQPASPFDTAGNGTARGIVEPAKFFGVNFAVASNVTDPQTNAKTAAPVLRNHGSTLSGDLRAVGVAWNRQHFNQGAPKPDGSTPGLTRLVQGTVDTSTKAYSLTWSSTIVGGPFNNFTGVWHLEGVFDGTLNSSGDGASVDQSGSSTGSDSGSTDSSQSAAATGTPRTGPAVTGLSGLTLLMLGATGLRRRRHA